MVEVDGSAVPDAAKNTSACKGIDSLCAIYRYQSVVSKAGIGRVNVGP